MATMLIPRVDEAVKPNAEALTLTKTFDPDAQLLAWTARLLEERDAFNAKARRGPTVVFMPRP